MASLGQLNHVLTNQNVTGSYTTDDWTCTSVGSTSVYTRGSSNSIQYDPVTGWTDHGANNPNLFRTGISGTVTNPPPTATVLYLYAANSLFAVLNTGYVSGPTVTSITATTIFVPSDTVSNTDFTLLKNGSAYANSNISLTGPGAQPPSDARGYTYSLISTANHDTGNYNFTIDSKSITNFLYDDSWTSSPSSGRSPNSNRILNVLATIPSYITIGSGSDSNGNPNPLTTVFSYNNRVIQHTHSATIDGVTGNIYINFVINNKVIDGVSEIVGTFYETRTIGADSSFQYNSVDYIIGAQQTMTYNQSLLGDTITYYVSDWVYSDHPEGDGYPPPVSTTSNGGGKQRRYPIISTNLFDRQKSIFSIGLTHKDETLF